MQDDGLIPLDSAPETDDDSDTIGHIDWVPSDRSQHGGYAATAALGGGGGGTAGAGAAGVGAGAAGGAGGADGTPVMNPGHSRCGPLPSLLCFVAWVAPLFQQDCGVSDGLRTCC